MKQKIFAICDLEEAYAFRMAEYIMEKVSFPYTLHIFTRTEELRLFSEGNEIFILLISESAIQELNMKLNIPNVFVLQEQENMQEREGLGNPGYQCISKFQRPEQIIRKVAEFMIGVDGWEEKSSESRRQMKLIGVYSPVRRCLQTSFALTMGQLLAREHKVLYLNFEWYSGFSQMMHKEFPADMLDVLYYFKCAREKLSLRLPSIVQNINGLDFIPPGQASLDMQGISGEKWLELLETLERISDYEYLILDLTDGMNGLLELLSQCYKIYTITKDDGFAMAKISQYEKLLQVNEMYEIAEKTVKCRFPFFEKLPRDFTLMTHGELAGYVKAIIREDLYEEQAG